MHKLHCVSKEGYHELTDLGAIGINCPKYVYSYCCQGDGEHPHEYEQGLESKSLSISILNIFINNLDRLARGTPRPSYTTIKSTAWGAPFILVDRSLS